MSFGFQRGRELTLEECYTLLRLDGPYTQAQEGWEFDYTKIDKALDFLKIYHRVKLGFKAGVYKFGDHQSVNGLHEIKISTYMDIDEANETLWHELAHASQAERLWREQAIPIYQFHIAYNNVMGKSGSKYKGNLFEIEARAIADRYKKLALLA